MAILLSTLSIFPGVVGANSFPPSYSNFRRKCATPYLEHGGPILRSMCSESCSWCRSFYNEALDLNRCIGVDNHGNLIAQKK